MSTMNRWIRLLGFLGLLGLAGGAAGCCLDSGSSCDVPDDCCSENCVWDDYEGDYLCE